MSKLDLALPDEATEEDRSWLKSQTKTMSSDMNSSDGTDEKDDEKIEGLAKALEALQAKVKAKCESHEKDVQAAIIQAAQDSKNKKKAKKAKPTILSLNNIWEFKSSKFVLKDIGRSVDDILCACLVWSQKPEDREKLPKVEGKAEDWSPWGDGKAFSLARWVPPGCKPDGSDDKSVYNTTKALRRLQKYLQWMADEEDAIMKSSLSREKLKQFYSCFGTLCLAENIKTGSSKGAVGWVFDISKVHPDVRDTEKVSVQDHLQFWTLVMHLAILDTDLVRNGVVFVEDMGYCGWNELMTVVPKEVETKIDRLTLGGTPIKIVKFYMMRQPWWMTAFMTVVKLFLSAKMRSRMVLLKDDFKQLHKESGGTDEYPEGFGPDATGPTKDRWFGEGVWNKDAGNDVEAAKKKDEEEAAKHPEAEQPSK